MRKYFTIVNKLGSVQRNATNPFAKAKYASLSNIQKHLAPLLEQEGCFLHFDFGEFKDGVYNVKLRLIDVEKTDNAIGWSFAVPIDNTQKNAVQAFGATTTYAQRYALCVAFQIALDDEDPDARPAPAPQPQAAKPIDSRIELVPGTDIYKKAVTYLATGGGTMEAIAKKYKVAPSVAERLQADALEIINPK